MICWQMIGYMQGKCLYNRNTIRRFPYVDAKLQVQFMHDFDKYRSSMLRIVEPGNIRLLDKYLTGEYEGHLWET